MIPRPRILVWSALFGVVAWVIVIAGLSGLPSTRNNFGPAVLLGLLQFMLWSIILFWAAPLAIIGIGRFLRGSSHSQGLADKASQSSAKRLLLAVLLSPVSIVIPFTILLLTDEEYLRLLIEGSVNTENLKLISIFLYKTTLKVVIVVLLPLHSSPGMTAQSLRATARAPG